MTYVAARPDAVWSVLVDPSAQGEWYLPALALDPQVGGRVAWGPPTGAVIEGEVRAWRPDVGFFAHTFAFTFLQEPPGLVRWRVTLMGEVTQVWLRHELSDRPHTASIVSGSWAAVLARLKTLIETGSPMPDPVWPETDGWDRDPPF